MQQSTYISDLQLAQRFGVSRATVWRWAQHGKFPQPVKLSPGTSRWKLSAVEQWEADQQGAGQ